MSRCKFSWGSAEGLYVCLLEEGHFGCHVSARCLDSDPYVETFPNAEAAKPEDRIRQLEAELSFSAKLLKESERLHLEAEQERDAARAEVAVLRRAMEEALCRCEASREFTQLGPVIEVIAKKLRTALNKEQP